MTAVVHIQATHKVSDNDVMETCVDFANMVFDQKWKEGEKLETRSDDEIEVTTTGNEERTK